MGKIKVDQIEVESASSVQINNPVKVDTISEKTSGSGVTIDGVLIRDGSIGSSYLDVSTTETIQSLSSSSGVLSINVANGKTGTITLTENITDIDFTNVPTSGHVTFTLYVSTDTTTSYIININKITVNGGSESDGLSNSFTVSQGVNTKDVVTFQFFNASQPVVTNTGQVRSESIPVTDSLEGYFDVDNFTSGTTWEDQSGNNRDLSFTSIGGFNADGSINFNSNTRINTATSAIPVANNYTCIFVMSTTDTQALFWHGSFGFLGAYSSASKGYHSGVGTPTLYKGTSQISNLYDNIRTSTSYYLEFSDCDFDSGDTLMLNNYSGFQIEGGQLWAILFYSKVLNTSERSSLVDYFTNVKQYIGN